MKNVNRALNLYSIRNLKTIYKNTCRMQKRKKREKRKKKKKKKRGGKKEREKKNNFINITIF